jgi:hypothetical protein
VSVVIMAKLPRAGAVKTRLCPPYTPEQAAALAAAALHDTIANVRAANVARRVVAIDEPDRFPPPVGFVVTGQACGGLDARLAAAAVAAGGPVLIVGMDTPQVSAAMVEHAAAHLLRAGTDAVLGPASDGGYWSIGLRAPRADHLLGVPMSRDDTGEAQIARLRACGARVALLPELRDVDTYDDALAVATAWPDTRFAHTLHGLRTAS